MDCAINSQTTTMNLFTKLAIVMAMALCLCCQGERPDSHGLRAHTCICCSARARCRTFYQHRKTHQMHPHPCQ
jgi:hypothetical protein